MLTRAATGAVAGVVGALVTAPASLGLFLGGLIVTALLHVWLLMLRRQPRPWSVVAPGMSLVIVLVVVGGNWGSAGALAVPATAFAVAGVITGFGPWREILGERAG